MFTDEQKHRIYYVKNCIVDALQRHFYPLIAKTTLSKEYFYVTGGCFASLIQGEKPKDFDVYSRTVRHGRELKDALLMNLLPYVEDVNPAYGPTLLQGKLVTSNAITLKGGIQFIVRPDDMRGDAREFFDFEHCRPVYSILEDKIYISELQYHLCKNKLLLKRGNDTPDRTQKFLDRGYKLYGSD
jgi:hypothetical protein